MNYAEIKQNLISLGFAEDTDYEEFEELGYTYDAINRAISQINTIFPYVATYEFEIDNSEDDILYLHMDRIDKDFLSFADTPVFYAKNEKSDDGYEEVALYKAFSGFDVERDNTLVIDTEKIHGNTTDSNLYWSFRVFYNKRCTQISSDTSDSFIPEIPLKTHHLVPLLAAYYLWLDDDERKATQYYNMYETELSMVLQKQNQPRMKVIPNKWGDI